MSPIFSLCSLYSYVLHVLPTYFMFFHPGWQGGTICGALLGEIQIFNQSIFHDSVCDFQFTIICISINGDDKSGNLLGEHVLLAAPLDGYHHLQEQKWMTNPKRQKNT